MDYGPRIGRISGLPRVPMPEQADPFNADMQARADRQRQLRAAEAKRREIEKAYAATGQLPLEPGMVAGTWGPIASKDRETEDLAAFSSKRKPKKDQSRVPSGWDRTREKVAAAIDAPIQSAGKTIDYYAGPHAQQTFGRIAQAGDIAASMTPVLGDIRDMTTLGVEAVDDFMAGEYGSAAMNVGLAGSTLLPAMFLGPSARRFPHDKADEAVRLLREGVSPDDVWRRTGIMFDSSGMPRFEIDDSAAKLTPKGERFAKGAAMDSRAPMMPFGVAYDHPELFDNYPQLMDYPTRFADDGGPAGAFYPAYGGKNPQVEAYGLVEGPAAPNYKAPKNLQQVILHEGQHAVDDIENASMGSMPANVPREVMDAFPGVTDYQLYRRAGGEMLANTTAARAYLDDDMRGAISPYHSGSGPLSGYQEQFPRSEQWSETMHPGSSWDDPRGTRTVSRPAFDPANPDAPRPDYLWGGPSGGYGGASREPVMGSVEEAATPVAPSGPRRRRAISGLQKTDDELLREAVKTPRKVSARGGYVGAPPSIGTPEAEQGLINDIVTRLTGYEGTGEGFYDEAQDTIRNWTDDPVMSRRFVSSSGHTSNMMSPLPNTNYAVKGMNQYAVGDDIDTGMFTTMQSPKVLESFQTDRLSADPKTGPYGYALLPPEQRPADFPTTVRLRGEGRALKGGAVHDSWDKVAFGYPAGPDGKMSATSDTEHLFMDRVYNKVAHIIERNPELRARYGTGQTAKERIQAALWDIARGESDKFDVLPFKDILNQTSGFTQMAAIPGPSTGIDPSFLDMGLDLKRQYTDDMFNAFSTPDGGNVPARALGMSPPMREGFGPWRGMMEPNRTIDYAIGTNEGGKAKAIDPSSAKAAETMRNWNQFALGQEGSGFTAPRTDGAAKPRDPKVNPDLANIAAISGVPVKSPEDFTRAFKAVEQVFGPGWEDNVVVQQGRNGELLLKSIREGSNNGEFQSAAAEVHKILGGTGLSRMRDVGNDFTYRRFDDPSYRTLMDETRSNPVLKQTFDTKVLPYFSRIQKVSDDWAARLGLPANTVPDRVRRIFIGAGERWPEAMDEAVRKGVIPAIAATAVYEGLYGQFSEGDGGWQ